MRDPEFKLPARLTGRFIMASCLAAAIQLGQPIPPICCGQQTETANLFESDFKTQEAAWERLDDGWKIVTRDDRTVLSLFKKESNYKPPHRSPLHIALIKDRKFDSFQLDAEVLSTHPDYNHRDVCLFFGYVNSGQYYYVHLGKRTDPHANQIFIVNRADRTKISLTTTEGTAWDEKWHHVRIRRDVETGTIEVYFDDMTKPVMTANDKTLGAGTIGVGSFDDTADFDAVRIRPWTAAQRNRER